MRVVAKRFFINTEFGNVPAGRVLTVSDAQGRHFIEHGLAEELKTARPVDDLKPAGVPPAGFLSPVEDKAAPGSSLPADRVLPQKIAKPSGSGAKAKHKKGKALR